VSRLDLSPSGHKPGPGHCAPAPFDPDRPTVTAKAELLAAVVGWLDTGGPTADDVAAWSRAFRALEAAEERGHG
jgi:hypothetical protein